MTKKLTKDEFVRRSNIVHNNKYGYDKTVYVNNETPVVITCPIHGDFEQKPKNHMIGCGCKECGNAKIGTSNAGKPKSRDKLVLGVGINDFPNSIKNNYKHIQSYETWRGILQRCYDERESSRRQTYASCCVCNEWLRFSNFKKWFDDPDNGYMDGYHLDKDILVKGNKIYSPDTCCFVPVEINELLVKSNKTRGDTPIGVGKKNGVNGVRYVADLSRFGRRERLGTFDTPEEAFNAYKQAKEKHIQEVALEYYSQGKITKKVYDALMNYKVEITD